MMYILCAINVLFLTPTLATFKFQEQYKWNVIDYNFPTENDRIQAMISQNYIPANNLPVGIEIWKDILFVTVPRWRPGVPSTLNYIRLNGHTSPSPPLNPYPNWASNELGNCETGMCNVHRVKADSCNRLWVLDTGTSGLGNTTIHLCPFTLNVFDLNTHQRIRRYVLRPEDINAETFIANVAVDIGKSCEDTFVYLSDELGIGLITYSWEQNTSWRFVHSYFRPDPLAVDFNIGGLNFQWEDEGIFAMSLSNTQADGFKTLFFSPIASTREFAVSTKILRNQTKITDNFFDFVVMPNRGKDGHVISRIIDADGVQFFNLIDLNAIGCWNTAQPYRAEYVRIVDQDEVGLIFPSDIKIDEQRNVWVISDRMPIFLMSTLDYTDVNFRIFFAPIDVLVQDTPCAVKKYNHLSSLAHIPLFSDKNILI